MQEESRQVQKMALQFYEKRGGNYNQQRWFGTALRRYDYEITHFVLMKTFDRFLENSLKIVEVGCGAGAWTPLILAHASAYTGVDQSAEMLRECRSRVGSISTTKKFICSDFTFFADRTESKFDAAVAIRCIEYFESKRVFFEASKQVIAPGGVLIIACKHKDSIWGFRESRGQKSNTLFAHSPRTLDLIETATDVGFEHVRSHPINLRPPIFRKRDGDIKELLPIIPPWTWILRLVSIVNKLTFRFSQLLWWAESGVHVFRNPL